MRARVCVTAADKYDVRVSSNNNCTHSVIRPDGSGTECTRVPNVHQLSDERRRRRRTRKGYYIVALAGRVYELFIGVDFSRGHCGGGTKFCGFPTSRSDTSKRPRGLTRSARPRDFLRTVRRDRRSNNTDLSHAKCDFISSSVPREMAETPFV